MTIKEVVINPRSYGALDILKAEYELRHPVTKKYIWETKDGKKIPVNEMTDSHIENAIRLIEHIQDSEDLYGFDGCSMDYYD